jgi:dipeptidyl aminopeptidase/acylaminoacyl peptidase
VPSILPFGSWPSPIGAELIAGSAVSPNQILVDGDAVLWLESRPLEGGRQAVCRSVPAGDGWSEPEDLTDERFNVRSRVHEYGGAACAVHRGSLFFSNYADQRLYRQDQGTEARAITSEPATPASLRYADATLDPDGGWLVCVRESHHGGEVVNELVVLPADGSAEPRVLATGRDFYAAPRLDAAGERLAWLEWDHPRMPWDGTELRIAGFDRASGELRGQPATVAGGAEESVAEPQWSPDGALHFISDARGWWNLYRVRDGGQVEPLQPMDAEFSTAQWVLGMSSYTFLPGGAIACAYGRGPVWRIGLIDPASEPGGGTPPMRTLDLPFTTFSPPSLRTTADGRIASFAGGPTTSGALVVIDPASSSFEVLRRSREPLVDPAYFSVPSPIEFPTEEGTAHALHYPPANPDARAPKASCPR